MSTGSAWVFAYGSNMELGDLQRWFLRADEPWGSPHRAVPARLPGFRMVWNFYSETRAGGAANVERCADGVLHGLALLVGAPVFRGIDKKEGYPHVYGRELCTVDLLGGERVDAWVYTVQPIHRRATFVPPTRHYRELLISGARTHRLPATYIDELERIETAD